MQALSYKVVLERVLCKLCSTNSIYWEVVFASFCTKHQGWEVISARFVKHSSTGKYFVQAF